MATVLCLHGLGGTAATMAPIADALRSRGHELAAPTLPGHGTTPEDLTGVEWRDWIAAVLAHVPRSGAFDLAVGQSMGADLALDLASFGFARSVVAINPLAPDADAVDGLEWRRERGAEWVDAEASTVGEQAYDRLPIGALLAMADGVLGLDLSAVRCPVLIVTSANDEVVDPASSDAVAASLGGPVSRLLLPRSGHVASLDVDHPVLVDTIVSFLST